MPSHSSDSRLLARAGALLFLASLLNGFVISALPLPRLGLSAHLVGLGGSLFLFAFAALWPALRHTPRASMIAARLAVAGFWGGWMEYLAGAATRTGGNFPLASDNTRGGAVAEVVMSASMAIVAIALFACGVMVFRAAGRGDES